MRLSLVLLSSLLLAACSGADPGSSGDPPAPVGTADEEIVHGKSDKGHDRAVVAIDIGGRALCSGALVGPKLVLTARHCVSETAEAVECPARSPQVYGDLDPSTLTVLVGDDLKTAKPVAVGVGLVVPESAQLCGHDLALLRLDRAVTGVTPLAVDLLHGVSTGEEITAVGFGKRGDHLGAGKKYRRTHVPVVGTSPSEFLVGESTCSGDSGGPALDASGAVVGVVSRGGPGCEGPGVHGIYTRPDAFASLVRAAMRTR